MDTGIWTIERLSAKNNRTLFQYEHGNMERNEGRYPILCILTIWTQYGG